MTDLEINIALAKAMGWEEDQMADELGSLYAADWPRKDNRKSVLHNRLLNPLHLMPWRKFDYRDPIIFVAICKHWELSCRFIKGEYSVMEIKTPYSEKFYGEHSIEKAAALCVIDAVKRGIKQCKQ